MYFHGILLGFISFICIGIFHPIVIKCQYHFTEKIWPLFLIIGLVCLGVSVTIENVVLSAIIGVIGCSSLWSILELKEQTQRVKRGWFPENPKHSVSSKENKHTH